MPRQDVLHAFRAAWQAKRARIQKMVDAIQAAIDDYQKVVAEATGGKARLELVVAPELRSGKGDEAAGLMIRGIVFMVIGENRLSIAETPNLDAANDKNQDMRHYIEKFLANDSLLHNFIALELSDHYGHPPCDEQTVLNKKMVKMLKRQIKEHERSEDWRGDGDDNK